MFFTVIWALGFFILMLLTIPFLLISYLLRLVAGNKVADRFVHWVTIVWGRLAILSTGSKVKVESRENFSSAPNLCLICNHQSMFDIPLLTGWTPRLLGFVAKSELKKIPLLNIWIAAIHSVFLDRSSPKAAVASFQKAVEHIKKGRAIVIFPEGTRSKDGSVSEFKTGSLKLATQAQAVIQPVTIQGTRNMFEAEKKIKKANLKLIIHPPILPQDEVYRDKEKLASLLYEIISPEINFIANANAQNQ
ncbi:MAG TPA: lysophospholipid acyltransferase family protein [Candidatus Cloacimonadota bacterium]|nr:lysophospholipid acyltransferase family protein [Candidatus Cloacimonadota bacterium]